MSKLAIYYKMNDNYSENNVNGDPNKINHLDNDYAINKIKKMGNDEDYSTNSSFTYESNSKMTGSYFCFECGAIMTTKEDKRQHKLLESHKKSKDDELNNEH